MICLLGSLFERYKGISTKIPATHPCYLVIQIPFMDANNTIMLIVFFFFYTIRLFYANPNKNIDTHVCRYNFSIFVSKNFGLQ